MTPRYRLTGVAKYYGDKIALELESLTILPGRIYVLTGDNGSGKSTLLSILAFLSRPERGEVEFDGKLVEWKNAELQLLRRQVTLLHQSPYLFTGTVFGNIAYGLKLRGQKDDALKQRVAEALALVRLAGFETRNVRQLSGGEARRVALARALALQPVVLLFDEPLANLDRISAEVVDGIITTLPSQGTTVVVATHDPQQAGRLGGDTIRLADNKLDRLPTGHSMEISRKLGTLMPTFAEARTLILNNVSVLGAESVAIPGRSGSCHCRRCVAPQNMPSYDSSAMDGYAVRESDCREPARLRLTGYVPAGGEATTPVEPGCAVKIMTGAPIPALCDAIVPIEETAEADGYVLIKAKVKLHQHMRFTGEDVKAGEVVIASGAIIRPPEISMLAPVTGVPSASIAGRKWRSFLTGDELLELGEALTAGKVINSNAYSLAASIKEIGAIPVFLESPGTIAKVTAKR